MLKTTSISNPLCMKQLLFRLFFFSFPPCSLFFFFLKFLESHYFTSSISEQVTPFPVSPSGQGPHWNPSAVSMHLTPLKQELTSHLGLLRLGSWVGKFTVPKPLTEKKQQFQWLKETSIMAFSWQTLWETLKTLRSRGFMFLHCAATSCAVPEETSRWESPSSLLSPQKGEIKAIFLGPHVSPGNAQEPSC